MKSALSLLSASGLLATSAMARDVPANVQNFYDTVKPGTCSGDDLLQGGFQDGDSSDPKDWTYCQQSVAGSAIFIKGNGQFANMDIDCDGAQEGGDGRCGSSSDTQDQTAFMDTVATYGIPDLNANIHPYIVFGNEGSKDGYTTFSPQDHGIQPLSVMAVVCGNKLIYGVWGDTNGDDGPPLVGEASLSAATLCYGDVVNGNNGHGETDVLYIAFTGDDAVPGANGAKWDASSAQEFEDSISALGDTLIARLGGNETAPVTTTTATATTMMTSASPTSTGGSCSWSGHCAGATCSTDDDCSDDLTCNTGTCGSA